MRTIALSDIYINTLYGRKYRALSERQMKGWNGLNVVSNSPPQPSSTNPLARGASGLFLLCRNSLNGVGHSPKHLYCLCTKKKKNKKKYGLKIVIGEMVKRWLITICEWVRRTKLSLLGACAVLSWLLLIQVVFLGSEIN